MVTHCPLCGYDFNDGDMACHTSCVFHNHCSIVCCPNCGYQLPDENRSHLADLFKRLTGRKEEQPEPRSQLRPLSALLPGQSARIVKVSAATAHRQERLSVFGVIPGAKITLQQRKPAYVLRVGFTELSIEYEIADSILVDLAV
ncbi:MAG TPA: FeoA domain-containing protein [Aggregatilineales bacterium]|jgi:Fe2+ transport system protein FeoA|nr:FeoA domain-containing protein [Aggregatilineales bacterium]